MAAPRCRGAGRPRPSGPGRRGQPGRGRRGTCGRRRRAARRVRPRADTGRAARSGDADRHGPTPHGRAARAGLPLPIRAARQPTGTIRHGGKAMRRPAPRLPARRTTAQPPTPSGRTRFPHPGCTTASRFRPCQIPNSDGRTERVATARHRRMPGRHRQAGGISGPRAQAAAAPADVQRPSVPPPAEEPTTTGTSWSVFTPSSPKVTGEPARRQAPDSPQRAEPAATQVAAPAPSQTPAETAVPPPSPAPPGESGPDSRPDRYYPLRLLAVIVVAALIGSILVLVLR